MIAKFCYWYLDTFSHRHTRVIFNKRFRYYLWCKDRGLCQYCGKYVEPNSTWQIEHIIPFSAAKNWEWINDEQNLVVSCRSCNLKKGTKLVLPTGFYKPPGKFYRQFLKVILGVRS